MTNFQINNDDLASLMIYSFRYVLGRMSYAPSDWVGMYKYIYPKLDERNKELLYTRVKEELEQAFRIEEINPKSLGMDCDRQLWHDFYDYLLTLKEKKDA